MVHLMDVLVLVAAMLRSPAADEHSLNHRHVSRCHRLAAHPSLAPTETRCDYIVCLTCLCASRAAQSYNIIQLFLTANLLTSTSTIPVLMGLWHTPLGLKVWLVILFKVTMPVPELEPAYMPLEMH